MTLPLLLFSRFPPYWTNGRTNVRLGSNKSISVQATVPEAATKHDQNYQSSLVLSFKKELLV
jgi:hypothetical protein